MDEHAPWYIHTLKWIAEKMGVAAVMLVFVGLGCWSVASWGARMIENAYQEVGVPIANEHLKYLRSNVLNTERATRILETQSETLRSIHQEQIKAAAVLKTSTDEHAEMIATQRGILEEMKADRGAP